MHKRRFPSFLSRKQPNTFVLKLISAFLCTVIFWIKPLFVSEQTVNLGKKGRFNLENACEIIFDVTKLCNRHSNSLQNY